MSGKMVKNSNEANDGKRERGSWIRPLTTQVENTRAQPHVHHNSNWSTQIMTNTVMMARTKTRERERERERERMNTSLEREKESERKRERERAIGWLAGWVAPRKFLK